MIRNLDQGTNPIQRLRDMIPPEDNTRRPPLDGSKCDPALILREEDTREWTRHQNEASRVMRSFNLDLKNAIKLDDGAGQSSTIYLTGCVLTRFSAEFETASKFDSTPSRSRADLVKQEYQGRYFGGPATPRAVTGGSVIDLCNFRGF